MAGAVFGEVQVSLFVAGAVFGEIWNDSQSAKCLSSQIRLEADCIRQLAPGKHLTSSLKHCANIQNIHSQESEHDNLGPDRNPHAPQPGKGKGKGKAKGPGIQVPDDCEIYFDNKQLFKKWQVGRCTAKIKAGKRCMIGWHLCWKKNCHKAHPGNECPGN